VFDGFGDVSVLYAKQLLDSAKEHIDGADILSQQVHEEEIKKIKALLPNIVRVFDKQKLVLSYVLDSLKEDEITIAAMTHSFEEIIITLLKISCLHCTFELEDVKKELNCQIESSRYFIHHRLKSNNITEIEHDSAMLTLQKLENLANDIMKNLGE